MNLNVSSVWFVISLPLGNRLAFLGSQGLDTIDWGWLLNLGSFVLLIGLLWRSDRRAKLLNQQLDQQRRWTQQTEQAVRHAQAEWQRSEQRFRSLAQQAPFGVMRFGPDGQILQVNSAWEAIWGTSQAAIKDYNLLHDPQLQAIGYLDEIAKAFAGEIVQMPAVFYNPAINLLPGRSRWVKTLFYPLKDAAGTVQEVVLIQEDVTQHKQAEVQTQLDHERFRRAILDAPLPIMLHAEDGEVVLINHIWTELTGYGPEEIPTIADWTEKAYGDRREIIRAEIDTLYRHQQRLEEGEYAVTTRTGAIRTWEFHSAPLGTLPDGRRLVISTAFDITDRRMIEDSLQESEERLRLVLEAADVGTWYYDFSSQKIIWSERCRAMFGLTSSDLSHCPEPLIAADEQARINQAIAAAIAQRTLYDVEYPITWHDGSIHWLAAKGCAFYRDNGEPVRMLGIASDITDRREAETMLKQCNASLEQRVADRTTELIQTNDRLQRELFATQLAEMALQESEARYRSVVNVLAEGVILQDSQGGVLTSNASAERILGLSIEQMVGRTSLDSCWQTIHEDGSPFPGAQHPAMVSLRTGESCLNVTMGIYRPDRHLTWISINSQPLTHPGETLPYAVVTSFSDITDLKLAQVALQESEAELRALFAAMTDIVLVRDAEGRCLKIAPTDPKNLYRSSAEMLGQSLQNTFPPAQADFIQQHIYLALSQQQPVQGEYSLTIGGRDTYFSAVFSPISAGSVVVVARDISDRKQAEDQILMLQRLALEIGAAPDLEAALHSILQTVCTTHDWAYGEAWVPAPIADGIIEEMRLKPSCVWFLNPEEAADQETDPSVAQLRRFQAASAQLTFLPGRGLPGRAWKSGQPEWREDVTQLAPPLFEQSELAQHCGLKTGLSIPLVVNQQVLAVLVFFKRESYPEDPRLIQSLLTVAAQLGLVLQHKQVEEALFQEKELAQVTLRSIGDAVITTDGSGRVQYLNPVAESLTGWSQFEAQGLALHQVFHLVHETTREPLPSPVEAALREGQIVGMGTETVLIDRAGSEVEIDNSAAPIRNREGQVIGAVMVFHDVSQTRSLTKQLSWQATHDALTGLVNRREFEVRLEQAVRLTQAHHQTHALCYLDLDRFKVVNDTCGHAAGDELLRQVTALFQTHIRQSDTLARLGGDEFGILLPHCPLPKAQQIANALREAVHSFRFAWQQQQFTIGVSIGLVAIDDRSQEVTAVLKAADAACYTAKNAGRNRVHVSSGNP